MRYIIYLILYLNIYTSLFSELKAQGLHLSVSAEIPINSDLQDSLNVVGKYKNYLSLKRAADSLPSRLQRIGFLECELLSIERKNDSSFAAEYFFGKRYRYVKVFYSEKDFSRTELLPVSSEITDTYFILAFETLEASLQKLNRNKTENGNVFAKLSLKNIEREADHLSATLNLNNSSRRTIDSITIKGYEKFPRSYLRYYAGIKRGRLSARRKLTLKMM